MKAESKEYYIALLSLVLGIIIILLVTSIERKPDFILEPLNTKLLLIPFLVGFLGLAIPNQFIYVLKGIQFIQHKIGLLLTFIILGIVFYLLLTPIAFLSKIFSKKKENTTASNFQIRDHQYTKKDLEKTW
ncbi:MAG: hypothetical protein R2753_09570 [Chitinophagales bacterium]